MVVHSKIYNSINEKLLSNASCASRLILVAPSVRC